MESSISFWLYFTNPSKKGVDHTAFFLHINLHWDFSSQLPSLPSEMKDNLYWEFFTLFILSSKIKDAIFCQRKNVLRCTSDYSKKGHRHKIAITGICLEFVIIFGFLSYPVLCVTPEGHLSIQKYIFNIQLFCSLRFC